MRSTLSLLGIALVSALAVSPARAQSVADTTPAAPAVSAEGHSQGTVDVEGQRIAYDAVAGTITVGATDAQDAALGPDGKPLPGTENPPKDPTDAPPTAKIFYVAYFKQGAPADSRPITFLYNGGPGSATVWLHMGAFGPRRVVTNADTHLPAAPYNLVNNTYSLLDASDLVFIDAPGTGFSRLYGKDKEKAFWGVDPDAHAFARFIARFVTKYNRWNSPKYLFGESYGTTRSAVVSQILENDENMDLNGVILLSQVLNFDDGIDGPEANPGVDQPYILALPTYAATAWYHHKLPQQTGDLDALLKEVEAYATGEYAHALSLGSQLPTDEKQAVAEKLHQYTGLPVDYWLKANLRVNGGEFDKMLQNDQDLTTGRLDSRFSGPTVDPLSEGAEYDPQSSAISSAYVSLFNNYVRQDLKYGEGLTYLPEANFGDHHWDLHHQQPGGPPADDTAGLNVMPDLAVAMKEDPKLKVMLNGGYFDLATPFFAALYEEHHLPIPPSLTGNIEYHFYQSGHMVYANENSLHQLHDNVAAFIRNTEAGNK
jgi:carboxypeptidase C (cathepsin A)